MSTYLRSERLHLREVRETDVGEAYHRWMNDPEVIRFLESRFHPNSLESIRDFVRGLDGDTDHQLFAIVTNEDDEHIGNIKLGPINWLHRRADIGLLIGERDRWGQGLASEAIGLVAQHAFDGLGLHKVSAGCYATNEGSARAFERAGFAREGLRRSHFFSDGQWVDEILLGRVAERG